MSDKIGDPLSQAAESGILGRRTITTKQPERPPERQEPRNQAADDQAQEPERVKQTLMFSPPLKKWLKIQAAQEGREMSEIVADALELYKRHHGLV